MFQKMIFNLYVKDLIQMGHKWKSISNYRNKIDNIFIQEYIKTHGAIIFILSNDTIQIDFFINNLKIIICENLIYCGKIGEQLNVYPHAEISDKIQKSIRCVLKFLIDKKLNE